MKNLKLKLVQIIPILTLQCSMISSLFLFSGLISILIAAPLGDVVVAKVDDTKTDGQAMYSYSEVSNAAVFQTIKYNCILFISMKSVLAMNMNFL